jgi:hypothetical protein
MKPFNAEFSPRDCNLFPLTFIYLPQHPFLKHTQFLFLRMKYGSL